MGHHRAIADAKLTTENGVKAAAVFLTIGLPSRYVNKRVADGGEQAREAVESVWRKVMDTDISYAAWIFPKKAMKQHLDEHYYPGNILSSAVSCTYVWSHFFN